MMHRVDAQDPPVRTPRDIAQAEAWRCLWLSKLFPPGTHHGAAARRRPEITGDVCRRAVERAGTFKGAAAMLGVKVDTLKARLKGSW